MSDVRTELISRLRELDRRLQQVPAETFLREQHELCAFAGEHYEALVDIVYDHDEPNVREAGMWLVRFLHKPGRQSWFPSALEFTF